MPRNSSKSNSTSDYRRTIGRNYNRTHDPRNAENIQENLNAIANGSQQPIRNRNSIKDVVVKYLYYSYSMLANASEEARQNRTLSHNQTGAGTSNNQTVSGKPRNQTVSEIPRNQTVSEIPRNQTHIRFYDELTAMFSNNQTISGKPRNQTVVDISNNSTDVRKSKKSSVHSASSLKSKKKNQKNNNQIDKKYVMPVREHGEQQQVNQKTNQALNLSKLKSKGWIDKQIFNWNKAMKAPALQKLEMDFKEKFTITMNDIKKVSDLSQNRSEEQQDNQTELNNTNSLNQLIVKLVKEKKRMLLEGKQQQLNGETPFSINIHIAQEMIKFKSEIEELQDLIRKQQQTSQTINQEKLSETSLNHKTTTNRNHLKRVEPEQPVVDQTMDSFKNKTDLSQDSKPQPKDNESVDQSKLDERPSYNETYTIGRENAGRNNTEYQTMSSKKHEEGATSLGNDQSTESERQFTYRGKTYKWDKQTEDLIIQEVKAQPDGPMAGLLKEVRSIGINSKTFMELNESKQVNFIFAKKISEKLELEKKADWTQDSKTQSKDNEVVDQAQAKFDERLSYDETYKSGRKNASRKNASRKNASRKNASRNNTEYQTVNSKKHEEEATSLGNDQSTESERQLMHQGKPYKWDKQTEDVLIQEIKARPDGLVARFLKEARSIVNSRIFMELHEDEQAIFIFAKKISEKLELEKKTDWTQDTSLWDDQLTGNVRQFMHQGEIYKWSKQIEDSIIQEIKTDPNGSKAKLLKEARSVGINSKKFMELPKGKQATFIFMLKISKRLELEKKADRTQHDSQQLKDNDRVGSNLPPKHSEQQQDIQKIKLERLKNKDWIDEQISEWNKTMENPKFKKIGEAFKENFTVTMDDIKEEVSDFSHNPSEQQQGKETVRNNMDSQSQKIAELAKKTKQLLVKGKQRQLQLNNQTALFINTPIALELNEIHQEIERLWRLEQQQASKTVTQVTLKEFPSNNQTTINRNHLKRMAPNQQNIDQIMDSLKNKTDLSQDSKQHPMDNEIDQQVTSKKTPSHHKTVIEEDWLREGSIPIQLSGNDQVGSNLPPKHNEQPQWNSKIWIDNQIIEWNKKMEEPSFQELALKFKENFTITMDDIKKASDFSHNPSEQQEDSKTTWFNKDLPYQKLAKMAKDMKQILVERKQQQLEKRPTSDLDYVLDFFIEYTAREVYDTQEMIAKARTLDEKQQQASKTVTQVTLEEFPSNNQTTINRNHLKRMAPNQQTVDQTMDFFKNKTDLTQDDRQQPKDNGIGQQVRLNETSSHNATVVEQRPQKLPTLKELVQQSSEENSTSLEAVNKFKSEEKITKPNMLEAQAEDKSSYKELSNTNKGQNTVTQLSQKRSISSIMRNSIIQSNNHNVTVANQQTAWKRSDLNQGLAK
ncbi:MAG: hypothetical protein ACI32O_02745 [Enterococcus sp.]